MAWSQGGPPVLLCLLLACSGAPAGSGPSGGAAVGGAETGGAETGGGPGGLETGGTETGEGLETGGAETGGGGDTDSGRPDTGGGPRVAAALIQGGVITCADPAAREEAPMVELDGGPGWREGQLPLEPQGGAPGGRGVTVADLDGDGQLDILIANTGRDQLYMSRGGSYVDEAPFRWTEEPRNTVAAAAVDFDDDGDLDVLTANRGGRDYLFINDGSGYFTERGLVDESRGSYAASWGDGDGDGDLDLFIGTHHEGQEVEDPEPGALSWPTSPAWLYENVGGELVERPGLLPESADAGYTFAAGWYDLDGDGDLDLYLVNDFGDKAQPDVALLGEGGAGRLAFSELGADRGLSIEAQGMGLGVGDLSGDGRPDLLIADWGRLRLLESQPDGSWADTALARGLEPAGDQQLAWGVELLDIDNDGDLDAPVSFGYLDLDTPEGAENPEQQPDALFIQGPDGRFGDRAADYGLDDRRQSRGYAAADLNGDGWLDLVKLRLDGPASIHLSRCGAEGWLRIALEQPPPNVGAVGARIEVEAGDRSWRRWIAAGGGNLGSMGPLEAHFGLGDRDRVDAVTVIWPDGERSRFEDLETRQVLRVIREE